MELGDISQEWDVRRGRRGDEEFNESHGKIFEEIWRDTWNRFEQGRIIYNIPVSSPFFVHEHGRFLIEFT